MSNQEVGYVLINGDMTFAIITKIPSHSLTDKYRVSYVDSVHAAQIFTKPIRVLEKQFGVSLINLIPVYAKSERVVTLHKNLELSYCIA